MANEKLGQEPAFPVGEDVTVYNSGMSKRFVTAKDCLCSMLTNMQLLKSNAETAFKNRITPDEFLVKTAYSLADELLKQENE